MNRNPERRSRRGGAWLGTLACAVTVLAVAGLARGADIDVALDETHGACRVEGRFVAPVSPAVAWAVLADYDSIGRFVRSVRASRTERRADGQLMLRQDAVGGVFIFRRRMHVLLEIHEEPGRRIGFRDVLGKDFNTYVGEWRIAADSLGTQVVYALEAEPRAAIARALCRGRLRGAARDLLAEVRAEMLRREGGGR